MTSKHPPTKAELLDQIRARRAALEVLLAQISDTDMVHAPVDGDWTGKDILAHIMDWEWRFLRWYYAGKRGLDVELPETGYKWADVDQLNAKGLALHRPRPLNVVRAAFNDSHQRILATATAMTSEEIYTPGFYAWTGKNALILSLRADTDLHYDEHIEQLEPWLAARG